MGVIQGDPRPTLKTVRIIIEQTNSKTTSALFERECHASWLAGAWRLCALLPCGCSYDARAFLAHPLRRHRQGAWHGQGLAVAHGT